MSHQAQLCSRVLAVYNYYKILLFIIIKIIIIIIIIIIISWDLALHSY